LAIKDSLNAPKEASVTFLPTSQSEDVKAVLRTGSFEVLIWRGSELIFQGPAIVRQAQLGKSGIAFSLQCRDSLHYLWRRILNPDADTVFADEDQSLIVQQLVDIAQQEPYSDYGLDVTQVTPSGVLRTRTYKAGVVNNIGQRIREMAEVANGFDIWVEDSTRRVMVSYPQRGSDISNSVVLDQSNIVVPAATWTVGVEDYISHGVAISQTETGQITGVGVNQDVLTLFGRSDMGAIYQDVSTQQTIDDHASRLATERSTLLYIPAPQIRVSGFERGEINAGDTVEVNYDYGLGLETIIARIVSLQLNIGDDGDVTMGVEL
jgi:hypothetical protein